MTATSKLGYKQRRALLCLYRARGTPLGGWQWGCGWHIDDRGNIGTYLVMDSLAKHGLALCLMGSASRQPLHRNFKYRISQRGIHTVEREKDFAVQVTAMAKRDLATYYAGRR